MIGSIVQGSTPIHRYVLHSQAERICDEIGWSGGGVVYGEIVDGALSWLDDMVVCLGRGKCNVHQASEYVDITERLLGTIAFTALSGVRPRNVSPAA